MLKSVHHYNKRPTTPIALDPTFVFAVAADLIPKDRPITEHAMEIAVSQAMVLAHTVATRLR